MYDTYTLESHTMSKSFPSSGIYLSPLGDLATWLPGCTKLVYSFDKMTMFNLCDSKKKQRNCQRTVPIRLGVNK